MKLTKGKIELDWGYNTKAPTYNYDPEYRATEPYYTGHPYDGSLNLYFAENRFYDAQTATWLSKDPARSGINWYAYCEGNPTTFVDPLGLVAGSNKGVAEILDTERYFNKLVSSENIWKKGSVIGAKKNGWLQLLDDSSKNKPVRIVNMPNGINRNSWAMKENLDTINRYALLEVDKIDIINQGEQGELYNKDGRYWVAVGPKVMNPTHKGNQPCRADEMQYGTEIDVAISDSNDKMYYIPCVVGDAKAHTYPNGIYQTGYSYPNGSQFYKDNVDGSVIEFCGKGEITGLKNYKIEYILVYDNKK